MQEFVKNVPKAGAHIGIMVESLFSDGQNIAKYTPKGYELFLFNREKIGARVSGGIVFFWCIDDDFVATKLDVENSKDNYDIGAILLINKKTKTHIIFVATYMVLLKCGIEAQYCDYLAYLKQLKKLWRRLYPGVIIIAVGDYNMGFFSSGVF